MTVSDRRVGVVAAVALAVVSVAGLAGICVLAVAGRSVPDSLFALTGAAVGALGGLLAPSPGSRENDRVDNASDSVPRSATVKHPSEYRGVPYDELF